MRVSKRAAGMALPVALALGLAACDAGGPGSGGPGDASYVVSIGIGEPEHLVPSTTTEPNGLDVLNALFTPLVRYDRAFRPVELAAESITTSDNRSWTVKLKDGWTFHNGEKVTADSYLNAWNAGAYGPNAHDGSYLFNRVEGYADLNPADAEATPTATRLTGLTRLDDLSFQVTLTEPYVNFRSMLGHPAFLPLPNAAFANPATNKIAGSYEQAPIGQGPFKMKGSWQHDQSIETEKFAGYAGTEKPKVGGVKFKIYQRQASQYEDLRAGQLDVLPRVPLENIPTARSELGDRFRRSPAATVQMLAFPTYDTRFNKVEIRKAISMAIDRQEIVKTIFADSQQPAYSFTSPVVPGYRTNTCAEACAFDPARARALFDANNGAAVTGGRIEIAYNEDGGHQPWVDATCDQLRANLGVECVGNPQPKFAELLTRVENKQPVGAFRLGWTLDYPAMESYLGPLYTTNGSSNYYGYSDADFDQLVADGDKARTPDEATKLYQQAEDILARDLPALPLRFGQSNFAFSPNVTGVEMDLFNRVGLVKLEGPRQ